MVEEVWRLVGGGNREHLIVEFHAPDPGRLSSRMASTACGYRMKTWDTLTWQRGEPTRCKHCLAKRDRGTR